MMKKEISKEVIGRDKKHQDSPDRIFSTLLLMLISVLCVLFSGMLLFIEGISEKTLWYSFCGGLITWGVAQVAIFFGKKLYKKLHDYHFSAGALCIILGCCGLVRTADVLKNFDAFVGLVVLVIGIIILQGAIQMRAVRNGLWGFFLLLALLVLAASVVVLTNFWLIMGLVPHLAYWVLLVAGVLSIFSFPILAIVIHRNEKKEALKALDGDEKMIISVEGDSSEETAEHKPIKRA